MFAVGRCSPAQHSPRPHRSAWNLPQLPPRGAPQPLQDSGGAAPFCGETEVRNVEKVQTPRKILVRVVLCEMTDKKRLVILKAYQGKHLLELPGCKGEDIPGALLAVTILLVRSWTQVCWAKRLFVPEAFLCGITFSTDPFSTFFLALVVYKPAPLPRQ